jgi:hypothetical protein
MHVTRANRHVIKVYYVVLHVNYFELLIRSVYLLVPITNSCVNSILRRNSERSCRGPSHIPRRSGDRRQPPHPARSVEGARELRRETERPTPIPPRRLQATRRAPDLTRIDRSSTPISHLIDGNMDAKWRLDFADASTSGNNAPANPPGYASLRELGVRPETAPHIHPPPRTLTEFLGLTPPRLLRRSASADPTHISDTIAGRRCLQLGRRRRRR